MNGGNRDVAVLISFNSSPSRPKGGWTHRDVDDLLKMDKLKPQDFAALIQLKEALESLRSPTQSPVLVNPSKVGPDIQRPEIQRPEIQRPEIQRPE